MKCPACSSEDVWTGDIMYACGECNYHWFRYHRNSGAYESSPQGETIPIKSPVPRNELDFWLKYLKEITPKIINNRCQTEMVDKWLKELED